MNWVRSCGPARHPRRHASRRSLSPAKLGTTPERPAFNPHRDDQQGGPAMSATGLDVFDKTLQTTNTWLDEIMAKIGPDRQLAWHVLGSVLRTLRDRIPLGLAAHLGAQLPILVRGVYYDQWRPSEQPLKWRSL